MSAKLGTISARELYLGDTGISRAYLGDTLVFRKPYLEIAPTTLWVYPDWAADNDVYSNRNWNID